MSLEKQLSERVQKVASQITIIYDDDDDDPHHHNYYHHHDHTIGRSRVQKAASLISRGQDPCQSSWFQWHQGKFDFEVNERILIERWLTIKERKT